MAKETSSDDTCLKKKTLSYYHSQPVAVPGGMISISAAGGNGGAAEASHPSPANGTALPLQVVMGLP